MYKTALHITVVVISVFCMASAAEASSAELQKAEEFLQIGDTDQALELLREVQVDQPENDMVLYGIAMAYHKKAQQLIENDEVEQGLSALQEARSAYARLSEQSEVPEIRADAAYNRATLQAQASELQFSPEQYEEGVSAIREAVDALESVVSRYPEHPQARHNLEYMRLRLKEILNNPPEEEEQESESPPEDSPEPFSIFNFAETDLPGANAEVLEDGNTVVLHPSNGRGAASE